MTKKSIIFIFLGITLLVPFSQIHADTIWEENFDDPALNGKGAVGPGPTIDTSGVSAWTIDVSQASLTANTDWFRVTNGRFEGRDLDGPAVWETESIPVSGYGNIQFSLSVSEAGDHESTDFVDIEYAIDGGSFVRVPNWNAFGNAQHTLTGDRPNDADWGSTQIQVSIPDGSSSISIRVRMQNDSGTEYMRIDDVIVTGDPIPPSPPAGGGSPRKGKNRKRISKLQLLKIFHPELFRATSAREPSQEGREEVSQIRTKLSRVHVKDIQRLLTRFRFSPGPVDGIWGPKTERAWKSFVSYIESGS